MESEEQLNKGLGVTNDDLAEITQDQLLENLEADVDAYETALEQAESEKENYVEQLELDKRLWDKLSKPGALRKLEPSIEVEKDDEYWELQEAKYAFKIRMDKAMAEGQVEQYNIRIEKTKEALADAKEKLERFAGGEEDE